MNQGKNTKTSNRRKFIGKLAVSVTGLSLGIPTIRAASLEEKIASYHLVSGNGPGPVFNKHKEMIILNDRPWNIEAAAHLLDDEITPEEKMFVRNNGIIPEIDDRKTWVLEVGGEAANTSKKYSIEELKTRFKKYTYQLTLECGGNGRSEFSPAAKGNQWKIGAVSCANWSGVRLLDLLNDVGYTDDAVYVGYYGGDRHLSGDASKNAISRGVPMWKAEMEETLIAYEMNGKPIPMTHGYPLRLVAGGFPASASGKWLKKLVIRDKVHDGAKMEAPSYRVPCEPVAPGEKVADEDMCIIEKMPVKSLITYPKTGAIIEPGQQFSFRGHAWSGDGAIEKVEYSIDFGVSWKEIPVKPPKNRFAWQHFGGTIALSNEGYYEIWARATDSTRQRQPMVLPGWNPKGYLNNACHRIAVKVEV